MPTWTAPSQLNQFEPVASSKHNKPTLSSLILSRLVAFACSSILNVLRSRVHRFWPRCCRYFGNSRSFDDLPLIFSATQWSTKISVLYLSFLLFYLFNLMLQCPGQEWSVVLLCPVQLAKNCMEVWYKAPNVCPQIDQLDDRNCRSRAIKRTFDVYFCNSRSSVASIWD